MIPQVVSIALQKLRESLPDTSWVPQHIERTVANFLPPEGEPLAEQISAAVAYVKWAERYPDEVDNDDQPRYSCVCGDIGWVLHGETDTWRPCLRCNTEMYERFESLQEDEDDDGGISDYD